MEQQEAELTKKIEVMPELIDINFIAQMLKCSTRHVRRLIEARRIPKPIKLGALLRWVKADIDRWFIEGCPDCRKLKM
jgi:predicted DNA-binding transcriptional regulator AlpA